MAHDKHAAALWPQRATLIDLQETHELDMANMFKKRAKADRFIIDSPLKKENGKRRASGVSSDGEIGYIS